MVDRLLTKGSNSSMFSRAMFHSKFPCTHHSLFPMDIYHDHDNIGTHRLYKFNGQFSVYIAIMATKHYCLCYDTCLYPHHFIQTEETQFMQKKAINQPTRKPILLAMCAASFFPKITLYIESNRAIHMVRSMCEL